MLCIQAVLSMMVPAPADGPDQSLVAMPEGAWGNG